MANIDELVNTLRQKNNAQAAQALKFLLALSRDSDAVYSYFSQFADMLDSSNSYLRTRGLLLIVANARWDRDNKIEELLPRLLRHIVDPKPITARQFIQALPELAQYKPELNMAIREALLQADTTVYASSMGPLVRGDIQRALAQIRVEE